MERVVFFLHRVYPERGTDDISLKDFDRALSIITSRFKVVPLLELLTSKEKARLAAITFDDGFLDNWVYAYPILKRRGLKAHLFITSGRIREEGVSPNLEDYFSGRLSFNELFKPSSMARCHEKFFLEGKKDEYLSWEELERMKDVFSFGAHGLHHGKLPASETPVDFFDGENFHREYVYWGGKPFLGKPRFKTKSSLYGRAFVPSDELLSLCRDFPKKGNWKDKLKKELSKVNPGRFESEREAERRIREEIEASNSLIEERLGVKPESFAWPYGHYSSLSTKVASDYYQFIFTTKRGVLTPLSDLLELPRVPLGRELFTVLGRVITFSTPLKSLYRKIKGRKSL